jgi:hypothetical protein
MTVSRTTLNEREWSFFVTLSHGGASSRMTQCMLAKLKRVTPYVLIPKDVQLHEEGIPIICDFSY